MFVIVLIILINITMFVVVGFVLLSSIYRFSPSAWNMLFQTLSAIPRQLLSIQLAFGWILVSRFGKSDILRLARSFLLLMLQGNVQLRSLPSWGYCGGDCTKEDFDRRRAVELKHGRICMFATIGDLDAVCWKWWSTCVFLVAWQVWGIFDAGWVWIIYDHWLFLPNWQKGDPILKQFVWHHINLEKTMAVVGS